MQQPLQRVTQSDLYNRLRHRGSSWLKRHVLYADRQIAVLNKPPGLVCQVHHQWSRKTEPLDDLNPYFKDIQKWIPSPWEPHHVHRLDKGTTGCFIVAMNSAAAKSASQQFQNGTVEKTYLALVRGGEKSFPTPFGRITDRLLYNDGRGEVHQEGKDSITEWKLLASSPKAPLSLLQLSLLTGNKHQLRLHLAKSLNTPILGDTLYSRSKTPPSITGWTAIPEDRIFLHASEVSLFKYLPSGQRYRLGIRAPLPLDFQKICQDVGLFIPDLLEQEAMFITDTRLADLPELNELKLWNQCQAERTDT